MLKYIVVLEDDAADHYATPYLDPVELTDVQTRLDAAFTSQIERSLADAADMEGPAYIRSTADAARWGHGRVALRAWLETAPCGAVMVSPIGLIIVTDGPPVQCWWKLPGVEAAAKEAGRDADIARKAAWKRTDVGRTL